MPQGGKRAVVRCITGVLRGEKGLNDRVCGACGGEEVVVCGVEAVVSVGDVVAAEDDGVEGAGGDALDERGAAGLVRDVGRLGPQGPEERVDARGGSRAQELQKQLRGVG